MEGWKSRGWGSSIRKGKDLNYSNGAEGKEEDKDTRGISEAASSVLSNQTTSARDGGISQVFGLED